MFYRGSNPTLEQLSGLMNYLEEVELKEEIITQYEMKGNTISVEETKLENDSKITHNQGKAVEEAK